MSLSMAAATLAGGLFSAGTSYASARGQMRYQDRMSSTAHQRQVEDLRKAGLNPILSANKGASSPSGAAYAAENIGEKFAVTSLAAKRNKAEIDLLRGQANKAHAEAASATSLEYINRMRANNFMANKDLHLAADAASAKNIINSVPSGQAEADFWNSAPNELMKFLQKLGVNASSASQWSKNFKFIMPKGGK